MVTGGAGGAAEAAGFTVSPGAVAVLGFSFDGDYIAAGEGLLTVLSIEYSTEGSACLSDIIVSNPDGMGVDFTFGECVVLPCDADCNGTCDGLAVVDECGVCDGFNADMDCEGVCGGAAVIDICDVCNGPGYSFTGNSNDDCSLDVLDIVAMIDYIISGTTFDYDADLTGEGDVNVLDVVALVSIIIDGGIARTSDAGSATMIVSDNSVSLSADGYIGGVQMTLTHGQGFTLNLTNDAMFAEYKTSGTSTILIIVEPQDELLFTTNQSFDIAESIVANSSEEIMVNTVSEFGLSAAYPNPFNPATTVTLTVPSADHVSVKVYNLMGQMVGTLADGMMEANVYSFTWDASSMSSGVYLIRAESSSSVDIQKVLLVK
jgi:hypothetical protein